MVNTYELIQNIENDDRYLFLFKKGLVSLKVMDYKLYYERYKRERLSESKTQAISNTAEEYNVSERTIRNAIERMES